jgi:hypothetical protein
MTTSESIKAFVEKTKEYFDTKIELTKLKTIDRAADVLSGIMVMIILIFFFSLLVIFLSIALALYLGKLTGEYFYGFLIVGGIYLLAILIIYFLRDKLIKDPVSNGLINKMLK